MTLGVLLLAAATAALSPADEAAAFQAAGFERQGGRWVQPGCDEGRSYQPGRVDIVRDLNGDGRPELLLSEGGSACYGNAGTGFWLLTRRPDGAWERMLHASGHPEFLRTTGHDGHPDVRIGLPGFCDPVLRWDGRAYTLLRRVGSHCQAPG